jgi:hypothetical protein
MEDHPVARAIATIIAGRDPQRLKATLTETVRLRALLPGGPIEAHGREDVGGRFHDFFADFDAVHLVDAAGEAVADRLVIHYRLHLTRGTAHLVCTQTAVCRFVDERLAVIDMLCSGLGKEESDDQLTAASGARRMG